LKTLKDEVAIVTGAGAGIGKAIARALAIAGVRVVIPDINADSAKQTSDEILKIGSKSLGLEIDITKKEQVDHLWISTILIRSSSLTTKACICVAEGPAKRWWSNNMDA
jgi:NADP-dependent 3-hydroxy acid dehydrogenase YdfG